MWFKKIYIIKLSEIYQIKFILHMKNTNNFIRDSNSENIHSAGMEKVKNEKKKNVFKWETFDMWLTILILAACEGVV